MYLIIPVAGQSTRFPGLRPKYLLNHPNGNLMIAESIKGLDLKKFQSIVIICLKEHEEKYKVSEVIKNQFKKFGLTKKIKIVIIKKSDSQPHTVYQALIKEKIKGPIFIKDSDNYFKWDPKKGNRVCYVPLNEVKSIEAYNKSYVLLSEENKVLNIVEKQVISDTFCVGGYGFDKSEEFIKTYEKIKNHPNLYVSHIIYQMLLDGKLFFGERVNSFIDWGTLKTWMKFKNKYATLFVDLDGTLVLNSSEFVFPTWTETGPIQENIEAVNRLYNSGKVNIIITTSRTKEYEQKTINQLRKFGVKYHQIIFGLNHSKRIIINDYSLSNPYKTADAINLKRDSSDLSDMLEGTFDTEE